MSTSLVGVETIGRQLLSDPHGFFMSKPLLDRLRVRLRNIGRIPTPAPLPAPPSATAPQPPQPSNSRSRKANLAKGRTARLTENGPTVSGVGETSTGGLFAAPAEHNAMFSGSTLAARPGDAPRAPRVVRQSSGLLGSTLLGSPADLSDQCPPLLGPAAVLGGAEDFRGLAPDAALDT